MICNTSRDEGCEDEYNGYSTTHAVRYVLQQAELRAATQETDESIEVIELATTVNTGTAGCIREEFECVTERGEIMVIAAAAIMNWTNEARSHRQRAVMEEEEKITPRK